jgi:hypothetical protein
MLLPQRPYSHVTVDKFAPVFFLISPSLPKGSTQLLLGHIPSRCQVAQPPCPLHLTTHHTAIERLSLLTTTWNGDDLVALSTTCKMVFTCCAGVSSLPLEQHTPTPRFPATRHRAHGRPPAVVAPALRARANQQAAARTAPSRLLRVPTAVACSRCRPAP